MKFSEIFGITEQKVRARFRDAPFDRVVPLSVGGAYRCRAVLVDPPLDMDHWLDHAMKAAHRRGWFLLYEDDYMYLAEPAQGEVYDGWT